MKSIMDIISEAEKYKLGKNEVIKGQFIKIKNEGKIPSEVWVRYMKAHEKPALFYAINTLDEVVVVDIDDIVEVLDSSNKIQKRADASSLRKQKNTITELEYRLSMLIDEMEKDKDYIEGNDVVAAKYGNEIDRYILKIADEQEKLDNMLTK